MRYRWGKHDLAVARNRVLRLLEHEEDPEKRDLYSRTIDAINQNIFLNYYNYDYKPKPFTNKVVDAANYQIGYSRFVNLICDIQSQPAKVYDELVEVANREKFIASFNPEVYDFKRYTHDQAVELTKEFYSGFDKEYAEKFMKIYADRYKSIAFTTEKLRGVLDTFDMSGYCIGVSGLEKNFMAVRDFKGIYKVGCTVHECGHAIKNLMVPEKSVSYGIDFTGEVESIFPEFVFYREMGKEIDPFQSAYKMFGYSMIYYETASNIIFQKLIVDKWLENGCKVDKKFYEDLKEEFSMRRPDVREAIMTDVTDDGPYVVSFAVVLELLHLYKQDRDKALYLFKKIISAPPREDSMVTLLKYEKELSGFEHLAAEYSEISQEYKKQLIRKM